MEIGSLSPALATYTLRSHSLGTTILPGETQSVSHEKEGRRREDFVSDKAKKPHRSFPNCLPAVGCAVVRVPFNACFDLSPAEGREN